MFAVDVSFFFSTRNLAGLSTDCQQTSPAHVNNNSYKGVWILIDMNRVIKTELRIAVSVIA